MLRSSSSSSSSFSSCKLQFPPFFPFLLFFIFNHLLSSQNPPPPPPPLLSALLPSIFGQRPLLQLWAYHYDRRLSGIGMHADFAAVNVNFWLTPTEAMTDRDSGGMVVWDKEAPKDWTYQDYNTADPATKAKIDDFLAREGARQIRIPHRQNRVVIFNSDLFHRTDDIRFRAGFENRRINVTMLYGHRDSG